MPPPAPRPGEHEPTGSTPAREPTARPAERLANHDAVVEQLAHGMVDRDLTPADEAFLQANGYRAQPVIRGEHELVMRVFLPTEEGKPPIVAFRGTVPSKPATVVADLDPRGIGMWQFTANHEAIAHAVHEASQYGPVVFAGHSLGGALAQTAASRFPGQADRVVTFQAPGVSRGTVRAVEDFNAAHPDHPVLSDHHRVAGDLVPRGGRALTPGTVHDHEMFGGSRLGRNPLSKHVSLPLAQEEVAAGHHVPISRDGQQFRPTGEHSAADDNAGKSQIIENVRTGLGGVVYGPGLAVSSVRRLFGPPRERASLPAGEPVHELPPGETTPHDPLSPPAPRPGDESGMLPPAPRPGEHESTPRSTSSAHDEIAPNDHGALTDLGSDISDAVRHAVEARVQPRQLADIVRVGGVASVRDIYAVIGLEASGRVRGLDDWLAFADGKVPTDLRRTLGELSEAQRLVTENPGSVINIGGDQRAPRRASDPTAAMPSFDLTVEEPNGRVSRSVEVTTIDDPVSQVGDVTPGVRHAMDKIAGRGRPPDPRDANPIPGEYDVTIRITLAVGDAPLRGGRIRRIAPDGEVRIIDGDGQFRERRGNPTNLYADIAANLATIPNIESLSQVTLVDQMTHTVLARYQRVGAAWTRVP